MAGKPGRLDVLLVGSPKDDGEESSSPKDLACKALWKAIKKDDYEAFATALDDYLEYRGSASAAEGDDD
jgi:hypothetical protein